MPWDYDQTEYNKQRQKDVRFRLERLINYGLGEERLNKELLKKHIGELKIPDERRVFLELLLWDKPF